MRRLAPWACAAGLASMAFGAGLHADVPAAGQGDLSATVPEVTFGFERAALPVPQYTIRVNRDGGLLYEGDERLRTASAGARDEGEVAAPLQHFRTEAILSPEATKKILGLAVQLKQFHVGCVTKAKKVADTGNKTLEYRGPDGTGTCSYNFSENKLVMQLTDIFLGVAETMDEGRKLDYLQRYDRLGLDAEMSVLVQELNDGQAMDVETIAPTLRSLAQDTELMQRVRLKASQLLSLLPIAMQQARR